MQKFYEEKRIFQHIVDVIFKDLSLADSVREEKTKKIENRYKTIISQAEEKIENSKQELLSDLHNIIIKFKGNDLPGGIVGGKLRYQTAESILADEEALNEIENSLSKWSKNYLESLETRIKSTFDEWAMSEKNAKEEREKLDDEVCNISNKIKLKKIELAEQDALHKSYAKKIFKIFKAREINKKIISIKNEIMDLKAKEDYIANEIVKMDIVLKNFESDVKKRESALKEFYDTYSEHEKKLDNFRKRFVHDKKDYFASLKNLENKHNDRKKKIEDVNRATSFRGVVENVILKNNGISEEEIQTLKTSKGFLNSLCDCDFSSYGEKSDEVKRIARSIKYELTSCEKTIQH